MKTVARDMPLSSRYQFAENVATLRVILPGVFAGSIIAAAGIPPAAFLVARRNEEDHDMERVVNQVDCILEFFIIHAFFSVSSHWLR